ncbi:hypothetical protein DAEQUDRAFT_765400 [Daedalea quercina L-15889]|uniref:Geranylgeranyl pyrophosphate synthetase n=1 Tax=Daedalea quercina L-15889 TaxID=1314783 RepID=A0A165QJM8_9APHY|nr:hypothetical protein DAEQUDRAFT_765400 [Daedalea quercina L-15889]
MDGLHEEVVAIVEKSTTTTDREHVVVNRLEYAGSYNWVEAKKPTIIVPGSPAYWRDRPLPYQVAPDTKAQFVDQAGDRLGSMPLYPIIHAVDLMSEDKGGEFNWSMVDFVADRNSLRKLLSWVQDKAKTKPFRIATQLAGSRTVLLNRWEAITREAAGNWPINFQRESTFLAPGCEHIPIVSHHRIVNYDFGGLNMVVRFSVDACIPPPSTSTQDAHQQVDMVDTDDLSSMLSNMGIATSLDQGVEIDREASTSDLDVIRAGKPVPQSSLIEITTRTERNARSYNWTDTYPQLYFSQTAYRFMAIHDHGNFYEVEKRGLDEPKSEEIKKGLQGDFNKLKDALQTIQNLVIAHGERGRLSLVFQDGTLRVFERKSLESCLPDDMLGRFERSHQ